MIIKYAAEIVFYLLLGTIGLFSVIMIYVLLRYGQSKILSLIICGLYIVITLALWGAATANFYSISFPQFSSP